jgi:hypothetical protein
MKGISINVNKNFIIRLSWQNAEELDNTLEFYVSAMELLF